VLLLLLLLHAQRALDVYPAASLPSLLLCHSLVLSGRADEAAGAARAAVDASGRSPAALSLQALLLQQQLPVSGPAAAAAAAAAIADTDGAAHADDDAGADGVAAAGAAGGASDAVVHEYVALCLEVLQGDPWALGAVQGGFHNMCCCSMLTVKRCTRWAAELHAAYLQRYFAIAADLLRVGAINVQLQHVSRATSCSVCAAA
jgi:hypothetical protein